MYGKSFQATYMFACIHSSSGTTTTRTPHRIKMHSTIMCGPKSECGTTRSWNLICVILDYAPPSNSLSQHFNKNKVGSFDILGKACIY